jgi:hypothetical protein
MTLDQSDGADNLVQVSKQFEMLSEHLDSSLISTVAELITDVVVPALPLEYSYLLYGTKFGINVATTIKAQVERNRLFNAVFTLYFENDEKLKRALDYTFQQLQMIEDGIRGIVRYKEERKARFLLELLDGTLNDDRKTCIDRYDRYKLWLDGLELKHIDVLLAIDFTESVTQSMDLIETALDRTMPWGQSGEEEEAMANLFYERLSALGIFKVQHVLYPSATAAIAIHEHERKYHGDQLHSLRSREADCWRYQHPDFRLFCKYLKSGAGKRSLDDSPFGSAAERGGSI